MPVIHMVFGPIGAGKTTAAHIIAARVHGICFSIDEWMMQLYGADLPDPPDLGWIMTRVKRCEQALWHISLQILAMKRDVVLDWGFMRRHDRAHIQSLARQAGYDVAGYFIDAAPEIRRTRVAQRNEAQTATYAFHITDPIFDLMDAKFEYPSENERKECLYVI